MIAILVAYNGGINSSPTPLPQKGRNNATADTEGRAKLRAAVVEQAPLIGFNHYGKPLPHIQNRYS